MSEKPPAKAVTLTLTDPDGRVIGRAVRRDGQLSVERTVEGALAAAMIAQFAAGPRRRARPSC